MLVMELMSPPMKDLALQALNYLILVGALFVKGKQFVTHFVSIEKSCD